MKLNYEEPIANLPKIYNKKGSQGNGTSRIRKVNCINHFSIQQISMLRSRAREGAEIDMRNGRITGVREWMAIDLLTLTGIRVTEAASLRVGDLTIGNGESFIAIRKKNENIASHVVLTEALERHLISFLCWKKKNGESIEEDAYLFVGQRGPWTSQAIQLLVKKYLKELGMYEKGKSVRALRSSLATVPFLRNKDLSNFEETSRKGVHCLGAGSC